MGSAALSELKKILQTKEEVCQSRWECTKVEGLSQEGSGTGGEGARERDSQGQAGGEDGGDEGVRTKGRGLVC